MEVVVFLVVVLVVCVMVVCEVVVLVGSVPVVGYGDLFGSLCSMLETTTHFKVKRQDLVLAGHILRFAECNLHTTLKQLDRFVGTRQSISRDDL